MGMAASQARLLTITARIHDVEYQAQSIQNAKVQLATQSDQVYQEYLQALDATTLTVTDWEGNVMTANFNTLCGKNAVQTKYSYALRDEKDRLIVPDDVAEDYNAYIQDGGSTTDPYAFAMYMLNDENIGNINNGSFDKNLKEAENKIAEDHADNRELANIKKSMQNILTKAGVEDYNSLDDEQKDKYDQLEQAFNYKLYKAYSEEIYTEATCGETDFAEDEFNYYVNLFKQIQAAGGVCVSISDPEFNGTNGDAANDSEWLKNMISSGRISISIINQDNKTGEVSFSATSPEADSYVAYTTTSTIDKTALAKAEAEYEHATKQIDQKDKKYDMDLSKLETERTALTTEYDSVKKVINENIERTFGIFS